MSAQQEFNQVEQEIERLKREAQTLSLNVGREIINAHVNGLLDVVGDEHSIIVNRILRSLAQKIKHQVTDYEKL